MLPAQIASSCCTTNGCAKNRLDWERMAISSAEIRATLGCGLFLLGISQLGVGVRSPPTAAGSPCNGKKS